MRDIYTPIELQCHIFPIKIVEERNLQKQKYDNLSVDLQIAQNDEKLFEQIIEELKKIIHKKSVGVI